MRAGMQRGMSCCDTHSIQHLSPSQEPYAYVHVVRHLAMPACVRAEAT